MVQTPGPITAVAGMLLSCSSLGFIFKLKRTSPSNEPARAPAEPSVLTVTELLENWVMEHLQICCSVIVVLILSQISMLCLVCKRWKGKKCPGVTCVFCACGACVCPGVVVLLAVLFAGPIWTFQAALGTLAASVILFLLILLLALFHVLTAFRVNGTTMTICNYWIPQVRYALAGLLGSETAGRDWYASFTTKGNDYVGIGVGPNSTMLYGWEDVAKELASWGQRTSEGSMKRENELGLTFLNSSLFPDTGSISLGWPRDVHAVSRPYIGKVCDGGRRSEDQDCDGGTGWNRTWLRSWFRERLAAQSFHSADLVFWVSIILHKIVCGMDIDDGEAKRFCLQMKPNVGQVAAMPPRMFYCPFFKYITGNKILSCLRQSKISAIKESLCSKSPETFAGAENAEKLKLTANACMDTILYAGGLSVPTVLQYMLALYYMKDPPTDVAAMDLNSEDQLKNFMWETLRRYCPVGCVPRWITDDGGKSWHHQMAILEQALKDPRVFPEPYEFKMNRPGLNCKDSSKSLNWADPANVHNDVCHEYSRACPGKHLSMEIILAFWQEFVAAGPWQPALGCSCTGISVDSYFASTFTLKKA